MKRKVGVSRAVPPFFKAQTPQLLSDLFIYAKRELLNFRTSDHGYVKRAPALNFIESYVNQWLKHNVAKFKKYCFH